MSCVAKTNLQSQIPNYPKLQMDSLSTISTPTESVPANYEGGGSKNNACCVIAWALQPHSRRWFRLYPYVSITSVYVFAEYVTERPSSFRGFIFGHYYYRFRRRPVGICREWLAAEVIFMTFSFLVVTYLYLVRRGPSGSGCEETDLWKKGCYYTSCPRPYSTSTARPARAFEHHDSFVLPMIASKKARKI